MELGEGNNNAGAARAEWAVGYATAADVGNLLAQLEVQGFDVRHVVSLPVQKPLSRTPEFGFAVFGRRERLLKA